MVLRPSVKNQMVHRLQSWQSENIFCHFFSLRLPEFSDSLNAIWETYHLPSPSYNCPSPCGSSSWQGRQDRSLHPSQARDSKE